MARPVLESYSSTVSEYSGPIEVYPPDESCEEDNQEQESLDSESTLGDYWETIIIYRKDERKKRSPHARCEHGYPRRILNKNGRAADIFRTNIPLRYMRYLRDLGNTMVNSRWRWITLTLVLTFSLLWLIFGLLWMLIAEVHGDLQTQNNYNNITNMEGHYNCTQGNIGFAGYLLMSIETQTTIGYGSRYPTEHCPEGVFMLCLQMIIGIGVEGAILGMFYVKMTRPCSRDSLKLFSRVAVICQRDGVLSLMFRVGDKRHAHIVGTRISAYLMETRSTIQGEALANFQVPLKLDPHGLLLWPLKVVHRITESSPLFDLSAKDLLIKKFEIVVIMVGSSESTGQLTQSRTSYLPAEIHWGHRFKPCVRYDREKQGYVIVDDLFNATEEVSTPLCSAQRLQEVLQDYNDTLTSTMPSLPTDSPTTHTDSPSLPTDSPSLATDTSGFASASTTVKLVYLDDITETNV